MSQVQFPFPVNNKIVKPTSNPSYVPRQIAYIMLHTSATPERMDFGVDKLISFFLNNLKWNKPGYHFYITKDGVIHQLVSIPKDGLLRWENLAWGEPSVNYNAIHVCYEGGLRDINNTMTPADTRTEAQKKSMEMIVKYLLEIFPRTKVLGHNQMRNKACPCFFVPKWAASVNINKDRIYELDPYGYGKIFK